LIIKSTIEINSQLFLLHTHLLNVFVQTFKILNCTLNMDAMQVLRSLRINNARGRQLTMIDLTEEELSF